MEDGVRIDNKSTSTINAATLVEPIVEENTKHEWAINDTSITKDRDERGNWGANRMRDFNWHGFAYISRMALHLYVPTIGGDRVK